MDPLVFSDGVRVTWRCGENTGKEPDGGDKCFVPLTPPVHSETTLCEFVRSYGWVYVWPAAGAAAAASAAADGIAAAPAVLADDMSPDVDKYFLGKQGASCTATCGVEKLHCDWRIETHDTEVVFTELGLTCSNKTDPAAQSGKWWAPDQPSYVSGKTDPNVGECLGYKDVPAGGPKCGSSYPSCERICRCTTAVPPPAPTPVPPPPPPPYVPPKPDPTKCWYEYGGTKPCWDADNSSSTTPASKTFGASWCVV